MLTNFKLYEGSQYSLGQELKSLFEEYGIGIETITEEDYSPCPKVWHEEDTQEFRVKLSKFITEEMVLSNWFGENSVKDTIDYIKSGGNEEEIKKQLEDFKNDLKKVGTLEKTDFHNKTVFSIFATKTKKSNIPIWKGGNPYENGKFTPEFELYAWQQAFIYAQNLKNSLNLLKDFGIDRDDALFNKTKEFKKFLKIHNVPVTINTIEMLIDYSYRLYKDSKFFYELDELITETGSNFNDLMNDFQSLV